MTLAKKREDAWNRGVRILDDLDAQYKIAVGIRTYGGVDTIYNNYCKCEIEDLQQGIVIYDFPEYPSIPEENCGADFEYLVDNYRTELNCQIITKTFYRPIWLDKPSDGVVLAESAMNIPQHTWEPRDMLNSTHMSMRNDRNTIKAINAIFKGEVGDFFRTNAKD